jgi:glycosyltransferase involved in cell wall biosynthesis
MKIGFALEYSLGHTTHAQNLKHALKSRTGIEPVFIDLPYHDTPGAWANLPMIRSNWSVRASLGALLGLSPHRRDLDAALFHTQVTSLFAPGLMRRIPSIVSLDATPIQYDSLGEFYGHKPSGNPRVEALKKRMNERAFTAARHLVTWSEWAKQSLIDDYGIPAEKVTVIPPGIDTDRWNFPERPARDEVNLLFVGGDFLRKGGQTLIDAFTRLSSNVRARLHIVSPSTDVPEGLANVSVYRDLKPNTEPLLKLFAEADVFVFPSLGDCLPLAIMEALSAGLPVIATDVGAIPEAVVDGKCGLIVPKADADALASAIQCLAGNSDLRRELGLEARRTALERFDSAKNYGRLISLIEAQAG